MSSPADDPREPEVDWTGVAPDGSPIEPLTAETFVSRLASLTDAVAALDELKRRFETQHGGSEP